MISDSTILEAVSSRPGLTVLDVLKFVKGGDDIEIDGDEAHEVVVALVRLREEDHIFCPDGDELRAVSRARWYPNR